MYESVSIAQAYITDYKGYATQFNSSTGREGAAL